MNRYCTHATATDLNRRLHPLAIPPPHHTSNHKAPSYIPTSENVSGQQIVYFEELRFTEQGKLVERLKEQEKDSVSNDISSTSFHKLSIICHNECDKLELKPTLRGNSRHPSKIYRGKVVSSLLCIICFVNKGFHKKLLGTVSLISLL
ncbi:hypothetical protein LXL04_022882 [Taraxacum kok-saghyz]